MMVRCRRLYKLSIVLSLQYSVLEALTFLSVVISLLASELEEDIPIFETRENNVSFYAGETATLRCAVKGLQTRFLVWRRMSEPNPLTIGDFVYSPDDRISLRRIEQNDEWNLIIKDVQPSDDGVYECAISSRKKYRTHVVLRVIGKTRKKDTKKANPKTGVLKGVLLSGKSFVSKGHNIILTCNATGDDYAPDEVDWFINGHKVNHRSMPRVRIFNDNDRRTLYSTLEIRRSRMADKGTYVCRGPDSKTSRIDIHILDEEKSSHIKRGDETPSEGLRTGSFASNLFCEWSNKCVSFSLSLFVIWMVHLRFIT